MSERLNSNIVDEDEFYRKLYNCFVRYEQNKEQFLWRDRFSLKVVGNQDNWELNIAIFNPEIYFRANPRNSQLWLALHRFPDYVKRIDSGEDWDHIIADFSFDIAIWIDEGSLHEEDGAACKNLQPGDHGYLLLG